MSKPKTGNFAGIKLENTDKNGARILLPSVQNGLIDTANAFRRLKVIVPMTDGVNTYQGRFGEVVLTPDESTITLPPMVLPEAFANIVSPSATNTPKQFGFYNTTNASGALDGLGNAAANWLVFQMRDGIFGGRSFFNSVSAINNLFDDGSANEGGNFDIRMGIQNDNSLFDESSTPVPISASYTLLNSTADTILFDTNLNSYPFAGQIILNNSVTNSGFVYASFWLEIVDSVADGYYAKLVGRMWDSGSVGGRQNKPFPNNGKNIIPLCIISASAGSLFIEQIQIGNVVNKYPSNIGTDSIGGQMTFRGDYVLDNLAGQYFYPGDFITDGQLQVNTVSPAGNMFLPLIFIRKTYGQQPNIPPQPGADWRWIQGTQVQAP